MVSGQSYIYSVAVTGPAPFRYQWYNAGTPVSGQTNTTYAVTAGSPGSTTYYVVVTNLFGAITSTVSTFTSISVPPPPTNAYATNILQLNPAGYWPMHETEAAAPGDVEVNYGSLGALGAAYYPDWAVNQGLIARQAAGALANDSDTAVHFTKNISSGSTVYYNHELFIPHTSPLTTLNPPFSVECWFYPTNTAAQDIWGQNGYEGLNAGASGGNQGALCGVRFCWGGGTVNFHAYGFNNGTTMSSLVQSPVEPIDQWYHLVLTCDASTNFMMYVNGSQADAASGVGLYSPDYWTPLTIGGSLGGRRAIAGYLDEFAVYTNAISDVSTHYNDARTGAPGQYFADVQNDHPVIYLRMDALAYSPPPLNTWPLLFNYGSAGANGVYTPGAAPGIVPGPARTNGAPFSGLSGTNVALFSGVSSYADAGNAAAFNPMDSNANFTVTAMFRGNPCDNRVQTIVGHGTNSWQLSVTTNGCLVFNAGNGNSAAGGTGQNAGNLQTRGVYNDGNWHQVAAVNRTNVISIYVDGALDTNRAPSGITATNIIPGNPNAVLIGADPSYTNSPAGVGRQFAGRICEVAFFTNALTAAQVQQLYNATVPPAVNTTPTNILFSVAGNQLTLSWPADHTSWRLQAQTNSSPAGLGVNWADLVGSSLTNRVVIPIGLSNGSVFYRLVYP